MGLAAKISSPDNSAYIALHFILIALSFIATIILAYIADLAQKTDVSLTKEYSRLTFDTNAAEDKKISLKILSRKHITSRKIWIINILLLLWDVHIF